MELPDKLVEFEKRAKRMSVSCGWTNGGEALYERCSELTQLTKANERISRRRMFATLVR